ncbi:MAG: hypothetical protein M3R13_08570 [Armatimonadota bacterium]|nr:hypothetical protein [Armatimonadota bacterium]
MKTENKSRFLELLGRDADQSATGIRPFARELSKHIRLSDRTIERQLREFLLRDGRLGDPVRRAIVKHFEERGNQVLTDEVVELLRPKRGRPSSPDVSPNCSRMFSAVSVARRVTLEVPVSWFTSRYTKWVHILSLVRLGLRELDAPMPMALVQNGVFLENLSKDDQFHLRVICGNRFAVAETLKIMLSGSMLPRMLGKPLIYKDAYSRLEALISDGRLQFVVYEGSAVIPVVATSSDEEFNAWVVIPDDPFEISPLPEHLLSGWVLSRDVLEPFDKSEVVSILAQEFGQPND